MKIVKSAVTHLGQKKGHWLGIIMLGLAGSVYAQTANQAVAEHPESAIVAVTSPQAELAVEPEGLTAPVRHDALSFQTLAPEGSLVLSGIQNTAQMTFNVRSDEVVTQAVLNLDYTVSPALLPLVSHIKVYMNDELMGLAAVNQDAPGQHGTLILPLDARFISDFNRLRFELVGHYKDICEDPASSSIWIDISKNSSIALSYQGLEVNNDLSRFPEPFFDRRDSRPLTLPMVFSARPNVEVQQAAGILASWFGVQAQWRGQDFPVLYNQLPDKNGIVFATNDQRPDFLKDYPKVDGPVIEMIAHPENPYIKLLLVLGRDDKDLQMAVKGIAQGEPLFRGQSVSIDEVKTLIARQPYDAPNWVRTDRMVRLAELTSYPNQLSVSGGRVPPIDLEMKLPPDLFLLRSQGITLNLKYRYTPPPFVDESRLNISLNDRFLQSFPLKPDTSNNSQILHIPLIQGLLSSDDQVTIPAFQLGGNNKMRFDFDFVSNIGASTTGVCRTMIPVKHQAVIDEDSTIDFSGYRHYLAMPALKTFAQSGFPFSRMADLSETLVVMPEHPSAGQLTLLFNVLGQTGASIGYPSLGVQITDKFDSVKGSDKDILLLGGIPAELKPDSNAQVFIDQARSRLNQPVENNLELRTIDFDSERKESNPAVSASVTSDGTLAAITGFQSPFNPQRSVIALMASGDRGYQLLDQAWRDSGKRDAIAGSVSIVRESGVNSIRVGETYYVGYLPWWDKMWYKLSSHPVMLAVVAVFSVILVALLLWRGLRRVSRRRLNSSGHE
ncbi:cellulose biosynthesis cyclic di-GMP-binding regulatory protein BcsB [Budvicia aquatica]|uniref:Cyclic di-GMP-binding protein n=1 Tax=Budvicia aquatica TaxID=82979 RepID=A0A2C6DFP2_9GAMM|nr:cellulose biosynthesis cyclic di-GMP-binding regulatory protein BcsB [Budvicia aquatica]PHI28027.1 cellulose biosynthesis cyclic di-GMP-binding regulatory protein BcsB [Budvicia aquatica]VFS45786.1 Cellulose synthase regulatory subunit [Budvicia aquatica]